MSRRIRILTLFAIAVAAVVPVARAADLPSIYVTYADDCTYHLTNDAGAAVTAVAPTTYQIVIATPAPFAAVFEPGRDPLGCNGNVKFRFTGPGVDISTTLDGGDGAYEVYTATFRSGAGYTMQDDTNVAGTRRTLVASAPVSSATAGLPSSSSTASTPKKTAARVAVVGPKVVGALAGSVSTAGKLALTLKGKPVTTLAAGRYRISVLDEASRAAFVVQQAGKKATTVTTKAYLGRGAATVALLPGQWTFYSTPGKKRFFVVTA
jgi:hypothetical protein